jgi:SAM-dependent methyltransferase
VAKTSPPKSMREFYDHYVTHDFPQRRGPDGSAFRWAGDEWVSPAVQENTFQLLLGDLEGQTCRRAIEIGPGSGKYTEMLLERTQAKISAYEFSAAFLSQLKERCRPEIDNGRLTARFIDWSDNAQLYELEQDHARQIDLFFAVDVFLMIDFQSVFIYLLSAALLLRPQGRFAATFADADSRSGWDRLVRDSARHSAFSDAPSTRFHWISRSTVERSLAALGFTKIEFTSGPNSAGFEELDVARLYVVAEMDDCEAPLAIAASVFNQSMNGQ